MAKFVKKFASKGFFQTVDLDLLERLLEPYADRLPFALSDLPVDNKERRRALYEHFLGIDESFPDELLDALHCILQLSDKQGLSVPARTGRRRRRATGTAGGGPRRA